MCVPAKTKQLVFGRRAYANAISNWGILFFFFFAFWGGWCGVGRRRALLEFLVSMRAIRCRCNESGHLATPSTVDVFELFDQFNSHSKR